VLNSWDYIEYAHSQVNITKVLQGSTLCFPVCAMAMNTSQTPTVSGIFCLKRSVSETCQANKNLWSGICLLQYGSTVDSYPGVLTKPPVKC